MFLIRKPPPISIYPSASATFSGGASASSGWTFADESIFPSSVFLGDSSETTTSFPVSAFSRTSFEISFDSSFCTITPDSSLLNLAFSSSISFVEDSAGDVCLFKLSSIERITFSCFSSFSVSLLITLFCSSIELIKVSTGFWEVRYILSSTAVLTSWSSNLFAISENLCLNTSNVPSNDFTISFTPARELIFETLSTLASSSTIRFPMSATPWL